MNLNDILAQQQANLNNAVQTSQRLFLWTALVEFAVFAFFCWVVYMFYARIRDIADELKRFRQAFETAHHNPSALGRFLTSSGASPATAAVPKGFTDAKYMPKQ
jgi:hypothetical protein